MLGKIILTILFIICIYFVFGIMEKKVQIENFENKEHKDEPPKLCLPSFHSCLDSYQIKNKFCGPACSKFEIFTMS